MLSLIQFIAVLATTFFAGAAVYINLVEHPARMSCSTEIAMAVWAPSYRRATVMQASGTASTSTPTADVSLSNFA
jgi:hypothetical protein